MDEDDFGSTFRRVLTWYRQGRYADALAVADEAVARFPERAADTTFWVACLQCRAGAPERAVAALDAGLRRGLWWDPAALGDPDLDPLRGRAAFQEIIDTCRERQQAARAAARPELLVYPPADAGGPPPLLIALHGRGNNARDTAARWRPAVAAGWLLAVPRSSQVSGMEAFCWDDQERAGRELGEAFARLRAEQPFDAERVVVGGFSQGGALAVALALDGETLPCRRFLAVAPSFPEPSSLGGIIVRGGRRGVRGWLLAGERDERRARTEAVHAALLAAGVACELVVAPGLGHDYPADFAALLVGALAWLGG